MATYLYLCCTEHRESVPLSRSGSSGNGPLAGNENLYKFLNAHADCILKRDLEVISDADPYIELYDEFAIKKAPAGEDRGQGGQETTTKNEPSV